MATLILRPNAAGDETNWTPNTGTNHAAVADVTPDDDDTYVARANSVANDLYNIADDTENVLDGMTINSVTVYVRGKHVRSASGGSTPDTVPVINILVKPSGGSVDQQGTHSTTIDVYNNYSNAWTTNPETSEAWTQAQINALQIGIRSAQTTSPNREFIPRVTQVYAEVDYDEPAAADYSDELSPGTLSISGVGLSAALATALAVGSLNVSGEDLTGGYRELSDWSDEFTFTTEGEPEAYSDELSPGGYNITGFEIVESYEQALGVGGYDITGEDLTDAGDSADELSPGSIGVTGADLTQDIASALDSGNYDVTGEGLTGIIRELSDWSDEFTFTTEPEPETDFHDTLNAGSIAVSGESLNGDIDTSLNAGALDITGSDLTDTEDIVDNLSPGSYDISGVAITQDYANALDTGSYDITGVDLTGVLRELTDWSDEFTFTTEADEQPEDELSPGSYSISGADLTQDYDNSLNAGALDITGEDLTGVLREYTDWSDEFTFTTETDEEADSLTPGEYDITGVDLTEQTDYADELQPGSLDITGVDISAVKKEYTDWSDEFTFTTIPEGIYSDELQPGSYGITGVDLEQLFLISYQVDVDLEFGTQYYYRLIGENDEQQVSQSDEDWTFTTKHGDILTPGDYSIEGVTMYDVHDTPGHPEDELIPGSFAIAGEGLNEGYGDILTPGELSIAAQDLTQDYSDELGTGEYTVTGIDAQSDIDSGLDTGVYGLAGTILYDTHDIPGHPADQLIPGLMGVTGTTLNAEIDSELDAGDYDITGIDLTEQQIYVEILNAGSFDITAYELLERATDAPFVKISENLKFRFTIEEDLKLDSTIKHNLKFRGTIYEHID